MADIAKYQIISADGKELNGTITIEEVGFSKRAVAFFQETTPNGVLVDINYTSENNISLLPIELADIAMIEVNSQLNGYGITGNLTYKLIEPESEVEPEVVPNNGKEEVPVYIFRSSVPTNGPRGQINFEFRDNEISCIGKIYKDSYNTDEYSFSQIEISSTEIDYPKLGDKVLQELNNQISEINAVGELGVLEIVKTESEEASNFIHYTTIGKVVSTKPVSPLSEVLIEDDVESSGLKGNLTYSSENGEFKLNGEYKINSTFKITLSLKGYQPKTINPFTLKDGISLLKPDQGNIELIPKQLDKQVVIDSSGFDNLQVEIVSKSIKLQDPFGAVQADAINKLVKSVSVLLIPFILKMLAEKFGITDPKAALEKGLKVVNFSCPANLDELNKLIDLKNKATKQLNNLYNGLEKIKVAVEVADGIITAASIVANVLSVLVAAFPSIPFAPDPTKTITTEIPTPKGLKSTLEIIADTLNKLKIVSSAILLVLTILIDKLKFVIDLLALMDGVIEECYVREGNENQNDKPGGMLNKQIEINSLLLSSTKEQSVQTSPIVTNVKGFEMSVIPVSGGSDQLQRRQAIAKNADGVIMLRGEPSFSANDQILIDELIFYINMNNLKSGASNETIINP